MRVVFSPNYSDKIGPQIPLAYVQLFKIASFKCVKADVNTQMYKFVRDFRSNGERKGLVVPLTDVWRPVELIPVFGTRCNPEWTCYTAVERSKEFYLNCFSDKATYLEVY